MKMVTWVAALGRLLIRPCGRPSLRQTKGKSLEVIITVERMSASPLGSTAAAGVEHCCCWKSGRNNAEQRDVQESSDR